MNRLIVFIRSPRLGDVMPRIAESLGVDSACHAYRVLVGVLLGKLDSLTGVEVELRFTPEEHVAEFKQWLRDGWRLRPQGAGDTGERLQFAFQEAFSQGAERVIVAGTDCPDMMATHLQAAWHALAGHDVILGPTVAGNCWLIGLRGPQPELFRGISWDSNSVFCQLMERARAARLKVLRLKELPEVASADDWRRFLSRTVAGL